MIFNINEMKFLSNSFVKRKYSKIKVTKFFKDFVEISIIIESFTFVGDMIFGFN